MKRHSPVLSKEVIENLPKTPNYYFDGTLGHGGHVESILDYLKTNDKTKFENIQIIGVDRDPIILDKAKDYLKKYGNSIKFVHDSYANIDKISLKYNIDKFDLLLLDLGVNLEHFEDHTRGFSVDGDEFLDMRYNNKSGKNAIDLLNQYKADELIKIFEDYGDFGFDTSEYIAKAIIQHRQNSKIQTSNDLKYLIVKLGLGIRKIKVIFQCIRIEVNNELEQLIKFLELFPQYINIAGKCQIITYHSIEDRIVKKHFKQLANQDDFQLINKHVIKPNYLEIKENKAARSGKLRIIKHL